MLDVEVSGMIWGNFISAKMKAAVHLGPGYGENLNQESTLGAGQNIVPYLAFHLEIKKSEIYGISTIEWNTTSWTIPTLLHDGAIKPSKVHVFSDSVLCLGKIHEHLACTQKWKEQIGWFMGSKDFQELNGIEGEPVEFDRNIFHAGSTPRDSKKDGIKRNQT